MEISRKYLVDKWQHAGFQKYFKNTGWMLFSRILSMAVSLFTTIFIARNLGPGNYGQLSYALSFVGIFSFLSSLGIDNILFRELIKSPQKRNEILGSAFTVKLLGGILTTTIILVAAIFLAYDDVSMFLIFILSTTFIFNSLNIINFEFQARVESKYPAIIGFIVGIILNILKIVAIMTGKGVIYLSAILLLEPILYGAFYWIAYKKRFGENIFLWRFNKEIAYALIRDSWPLMFTAAFALIYSRIDQIFIKHMIDVEAVGIYDAAVRIAEVWYFIPSIIASSLFPAIVNAKITSEQIYRARLVKLTAFLVGLSALVAFITMILAPFIIGLLYGPAFMGGIIILQVYVWSGVAISLGNIANNYLITENHRKTLFFMSLLSMSSNIILNLLWIPKYGIVGSAYATLVSYSLGPLSLLFFKHTRDHIFSMRKSV